LSHRGEEYSGVWKANSEGFGGGRRMCTKGGDVDLDLLERRNLGAAAVKRFRDCCFNFFRLDVFDGVGEAGGPALWSSISPLIGRNRLPRICCSLFRIVLMVFFQVALVFCGSSKTEREAWWLAVNLGGYGGSRMNAVCLSVSSRRLMEVKALARGEAFRGLRLDLDRDGVVEMTKWYRLRGRTFGRPRASSSP